MPAAFTGHSTHFRLSYVWHTKPPNVAGAGLEVRWLGLPGIVLLTPSRQRIRGVKRQFCGKF